MTLPSPILALLIALSTLIDGYHSVKTAPYLNYQSYIVNGAETYVSFRLKVINPTDTLAIIERVQPSCGCVLATVQRSFSTSIIPGEIYIAVTTEKMDTLQPVTVDVYTNQNRIIPLRLYIKRKISN